MNIAGPGTMRKNSKVYVEERGHKLQGRGWCDQMREAAIDDCSLGDGWNLAW